MNIISNKEFSDLTLEERINYTFNECPERTILTTSFGIESVIMLDICSKMECCYYLSVIFIDTGQMFPETYQYAELLMKKYDLFQYYIFSPKMTIARLISLYGEEWKTERDCWLHKTKIEPMHRAIHELDANTWMSGIRSSQNENRKDKSFIEWDEFWSLWKIHPILDWTNEMIKEYFIENELPKHPLSEKYKRVGDWWDSENNLECGLHSERY